MTTNEKINLKQSYNNFAEQREKSTVETWKFKEREQFLEQIIRENRSTLLELALGRGAIAYTSSKRG